MNNEAPQKLQRDGMERAARAARELALWFAKEYMEPKRAPTYCLAHMSEHIERTLIKFAVRCANEARLEALEQAAKAASRCDIRAIGEGAIRIRIAEKIRALKAEPVPPPKPAREAVKLK